MIIRDYWENEEERNGTLVSAYMNEDDTIEITFKNGLGYCNLYVNRKDRERFKQYVSNILELGNEKEI